MIESLTTIAGTIVGIIAVLFVAQVISAIVFIVSSCGRK